MPLRYDACTLRLDSKRTAQGFIRADAIIARTGVQVYRRADGTEQREYRPPETVFHPDALASFSLAPLTLHHPPVPVTAANARQYAVGTTGEIVARKDGKYVATTVLVTDPVAIASVESGDTVELSCGYQCDLDFTPGVTPDGERYDAVQIGVRGNHVALVPHGRAGPEARIKIDRAEEIGALRLDVNDAVQVASDPLPHFQYSGRLVMGAKDGDKKMKVAIKIDGMDFAVRPKVAQAIDRLNKIHTDEVASLRSQLAAAKAETTAVKAEAEKLKADVASEKIRADKALEETKSTLQKSRELAGARFALEEQARKVLGAEAKLDAMTDDQVRRAVVTKLAPELKLDGKDEAYVLARYDVAIEDAAKKPAKNPAADARFGAMGDPNRKDAGADPGNEDPAAKSKAAREKFKADSRDAWKTLGAPPAAKA